MSDDKRCPLFCASPTENYLFFGCRGAHKDFYCRREWESLEQKNLLTLFTAFSRDQVSIDWLIVDHLCSAILRSLEQTHCAWMWFYMSDQLSIVRFLNIHWSGVLTALVWLVPHETAAVSAQILGTSYNHAPCHFMQSHIRIVYACLAVTCHLHFWQNNRDLLCATGVTQGWNGSRNKSQHRKSTLEKKILPPLLQGFEPVTFQSRVWCSKHWVAC